MLPELQAPSHISVSREQLGSEMALAGREGEEPVQPGHEDRSGRLALDGLDGLANGVDLVGVEGLE